MASKKPKAIGFLTIGLVEKDVQLLTVQERLYRQLFMDPEDVNELNAAAPVAFAMLQDALHQEMALGVTRVLIDPAKQGSFANLGLEQVIVKMPCDRPDLLKRIDTLRMKYRLITDLRRKVRAHRDEATAYAIANNESDLWPPDFELVSEAIGDINDLMDDAVASLVPGSTVHRELDVPTPEGDVIVQAIRALNAFGKASTRQ